jgi:hypothetical protein
MINPPPRPALRKAPDADVHPVAAVPTVVAAPPVPAPRPTELRPVVGIGGRTSDTLVRRTPKKVKKSTLEVKVPKTLLKSAAQVAKTRGDRLDDVVASALQGYVGRG